MMRVANSITASDTTTENRIKTHAKILWRIRRPRLETLEPGGYARTDGRSIPYSLLRLTAAPDASSTVVLEPSAEDIPSRSRHDLCYISGGWMRQRCSRNLCKAQQEGATRMRPP